MASVSVGVLCILGMSWYSLKVCTGGLRHLNKHLHFEGSTVSSVCGNLTLLLLSFDFYNMGTFPPSLVQKCGLRTVHNSPLITVCDKLRN